MKNADHYAIVVGIQDYAGLQTLQAAKKDAVRFTEWLLREDGGNLPETNIHQRLSPASRPEDPFKSTPVLSDIQSALTAIGVRKGTRLGARLYFYFAGHGVGPKFDNVAMLVATAARDLLEENIGLDETRQYFHDIGVFDEVIYILDCCREKTRATCRGIGITPKPHAGAATNDFVLIGSVHGGKSFEVFDESTGARRGLLTQALLEGLDGAPGALDTQRRITSQTLADYVARRVSELSTAAGLSQQLDTPKPANPTIVLKALLAGADETYRLTVARGAASQGGEIVVANTAGNEVGRAAPGLDFQEDVPVNGVYQITLVGGGYVAIAASNMVKEGVLRVQLP